MDITLERYHGLGNDYLVYDPNKNELELNEENVKSSVTGIWAWEQTEFWKDR